MSAYSMAFSRTRCGEISDRKESAEVEAWKFTHTYSKNTTLENECHPILQEHMGLPGSKHYLCYELDITILLLWQSSTSHS